MEFPHEPLRCSRRELPAAVKMKENYVLALSSMTFDLEAHFDIDKEKHTIQRKEKMLRLCSCSWFPDKSLCENLSLLKKKTSENIDKVKDMIQDIVVVPSVQQDLNCADWLWYIGSYVDVSKTINNVKVKIQNTEAIPARQWSLSLAGKHLENALTVRHKMS
jgi:hypothetical protein